MTHMDIEALFSKLLFVTEEEAQVLLDTHFPEYHLDLQDDGTTTIELPDSTIKIETTKLEDQ